MEKMQSPDNNIVERLSKIFVDTLEIPEFDPEAGMEDIPQWDSLKHIQILAAIEDEFHIRIQFEDAVDMISIPAIIEVVKKYLRENI